MTLALKGTLARLGQQQRMLAQALGISRPAVSLIIGRDRWPATQPKADLQARIRAFLEAHGATPEEVAGAFEPAGGAMPADTAAQDEEIEMFLAKQTLSPNARKHFGLFRNPFDEPREVADVWLGDRVRYVREAIWDTARNGGFRVIVGESGSGKTTLREELADRILRENAAVQVIEPYVLGLEDSETKGTPLRSTQIAEAIIGTLTPTERPKQSPQLRFKQCHDALIESRRAGYSNLLQIEEAHCLPVSTLKHLKRFAELKDGLRPVLGIVLYGQTELARKLDGASSNVREVVQRAEVVTLEPLDEDMEGYLRHRFDRIGKRLDEVIDATGLDALRERLMPSQRVRRAGKEVVEPANLRYPLAVHNALTSALNLAAYLGAPKVTADIVRGC